jgi:lipopolysaccharide export system protein LptA
MRRLLAIAIILASFVPPAFAEEDPVHITADKFVIDESTNVATFTGNVVVKRKTLTVWAPTVVVDYGEGGPSDINSFEATGGVRIKTKDQDVTGNRAIYDPNSETLRVTGNVMVLNKSSTVGSGDMIVDLNTDKTVFTGGGSTGRVTGVFTPK